MFWGNKNLIIKCFLLLVFLGHAQFFLKGMDDAYDSEKTPLISSNTSINYNSTNNLSHEFMQNSSNINLLFLNATTQQQKGTLINALNNFLFQNLFDNTKFVFDKWIKEITNQELRKSLIKNIVDIITQAYGSINSKVMTSFFSKQPEGIIKTAIRFIHLRKTGSLIDSKNIKELNLELLKANKNGILNFEFSFSIEDSFPLSTLLSLFPYLCEIIPHICQRPIIELNLFGNLFSTLPSEIYYLQDLNTINLSGNKFKTLPINVLLFRNLKNITIDQKLKKNINLNNFPNDTKFSFYASKQI